MANVSGQGTLWNLPNYSGMLWTADAESTPFLTMAGGITGGKQSNNVEFPCSVTYEYAAAAQPAISETASLTAPTAVGYTQTQVKNVTQIFQEAISVSYSKLASQGRLSGINTAGQVGVTDELTFQTQRALIKIARDVEKSFLEGSYVAASAASIAHKTRGILEAATTDIDALGATLDKTLMDQLFRDMATAGASFTNMVIFVNAFLKQKITGIYAYAPQDRNVGGVNIKQIETDFGNVGVVFNRFVTADNVICADMAYCAPVFQVVPEKGLLFREELAKTGASSNWQIYGQIGLDYGNGALHGVIQNCATS